MRWNMPLLRDKLAPKLEKSWRQIKDVVQFSSYSYRTTSGRVFVFLLTPRTSLKMRRVACQPNRDPERCFPNRGPSAIHRKAGISVLSVHTPEGVMH